MCVEFNSTSKILYLAAPPHSSGNLNHLNMKSEADHRKTYEIWRVPFMDTNQLAATGFYFTSWSDVVRCAFWSRSRELEGDDAFKDLQRWNPSCGFVQWLFVGNIPIRSKHQLATPSSSQHQPSSSCYVCVRCMEHCKPIFTFIYFFSRVKLLRYTNVHCVSYLQVSKCFNTIYDSKIHIDGMTLLQVNCRSICNKILEFGNLIDIYDPDVVA